jgi:site-specific DNA-methyltransferase (adenine-specific)
MSDVTVHHGDSRDVLKTLADASIDAVVCDPPYALVSIGKRFGKAGSAPAQSNGASGVYARASAGFMGQQWDVGETAFAVEFWTEVYRVLKPGAHVVAFSGTRTYHRLACAIEDAGFEIRDQAAWCYGSGFPKSHDVSKAIDKHLGYERAKVRRAAPKNPPNLVGGIGKGDSRPWVEKAREAGFHEAASQEAASQEAASWSGWGTALKPAWEPICVARKPLEGTIAGNVLAHGTGALNIDATRIGEAMRSRSTGSKISDNGSMAGGNYSREIVGEARGRWPANILTDGSPEVLAAFPVEAKGGGAISGAEPSAVTNGIYGEFNGRVASAARKDSGSAARFFYSAKADAEDRLGSKHPTVKPVDLMQWLCRLVTPPGGLILDPFAGSGSTGLAAMNEGFDCILIEREERFVADINRRLAWARGEGKLTALELARDIDGHEARGLDLPLFADNAQPASQPADGSSTGPSPATTHRTDGNEEVVAA